MAGPHIKAELRKGEKRALHTLLNSTKLSGSHLSVVFLQQKQTEEMFLRPNLGRSPVKPFYTYVEKRTQASLNSWCVASFNSVNPVNTILWPFLPFVLVNIVKENQKETKDTLNVNAQANTIAITYAVLLFIKFL